MLKLYYWHRPLEDFATQEVIAAPLFVAPGASKQWEYCFAVAAPVRNIVYVSPQILIGATPHPQGIAGETKEMNLAFAATQTLDGVRAAGRIVSVADPARVLNQFSLDLPGLNPRDIVTRSVPVTLEKNASLLLRLSFTRHLKEWHPGEDVNDREDVVIPVVVGISHPGEVVYRDRTRRDSRLRQVQPRALKAVQMHESEAFDAFAYPPGDRCFRRDTLQASTQGPARLYACAGEYESVQIVLVPKPGRDAVYAVDRGELLGPDGARIQCESVNEFLYVPTRMPSGYNARLGVGEFPEALLPVSDVALKGDGAHPLFVTYRVPPEAKPGLYRGAVLLSSGGARHALPVEMTVWNIPMPQRSRWMDTPASLKGDAFVGAVPRDKDGKALGRQEQSRLIVDMHLKYRLTPCDAGLARYLLALDFDAFEPEMRRYIGAGATRIYLGSAQAILKGHADTLPVIEKYLREKGWIDHFYVRPGFDEASTELLPQIRAVCEAWKKVSSIPLMETYYHDKPEGLYGMLDIYCRGVSDAPWIRQRLAAGDRFWKVNAFPNALEPAPWIIRRSYLSFFDYAFTGTYLWTVKQWTGVAKWGEDYWCDGGVGNLAAVLMWPHETGILSTIRLEALRDAIEDNALFWMLREKVASLEGTPETQALNTARALVAAPLAQDVHTLDQLDSLRRAAGDLLSALNTAHPHK